MGTRFLLQGTFLTLVSCIAGRFFTIWATREPLFLNLNWYFHHMKRSLFQQRYCCGIGLMIKLDFNLICNILKISQDAKSQTWLSDWADWPTTVEKVRPKKSIYCVILVNSKAGTSPVVKNLPANAEDTGWTPGLGRSHMQRSSWACDPQLSPRP